MTNRTREAARPRTQTTAHDPSTLPPSLHRYGAQMAVDCIIALALFETVPWLEIQITRDLLAELGPRLRRSCAVGVAIRLTRERAQREGWPWPSLDEVIAMQLAKGGVR